MIWPETSDQWALRSAAASLADTLHNLRVLSDDEFDQLLDKLYQKYGDEIYANGNTWCYDSL